MNEWRKPEDVDIDELIAIEKGYNLALRKLMHADPVGFFSPRNKQRWPKRLGIEGSAIHTAHWAFRLAQLKALRSEEKLAVKRYLRFWPLPVGRELLRQHDEVIRSTGKRAVFGDWSFLQSVAPCTGEEWAAWILDTEVNATRVEAFGLVEPHTASISGWDGYVFRPTRAAFRVTGANPHSSDVIQLCRGVGDWWNGYAGLTMHRGRPRSEVTYEQAQAAYWDCFDAFEAQGESPRPSQPDVLDRMAIDGLVVGTTKFGELIREWRSSGRDWPPSRPQHEAQS